MNTLTDNGMPVSSSSHILDEDLDLSSNVVWTAGSTLTQGSCWWKYAGHGHPHPTMRCITTVHFWLVYSSVHILLSLYFDRFVACTCRQWPT